MLTSQTWVPQTSGVSTQLLSVCFADTSTGWAGTLVGDVLKTTNGGLNWTGYFTGEFAPIRSLYFINNTTGFASGDLGVIFKTTNGGVNWVLQESFTVSSLYKIRFANSLTGWATGYFNTIVKTTNGGLNWTRQFFGNNINYSIFPITTNTILTSGTNGEITKTTNGGVNWIVTNSNQLYELKDINFPTPLIGIAVGSGSPICTILRSSNSGDNWYAINVTGGMGLNAVHFPTSTSGWACGNNATIIYTSDAGTNWIQQNSGVSGLNLKDIFFVNSSTGWAVGDMGTIIKTTNGGISSLNPISSTLPSEFSLSQNYPNPFNPVTKIRFSISGQSTAQTFLSVFDVLGNEVAVFVNQKLKPGVYEVDWDASSYPSGVYFYKLNAGEFSLTKRMVLIK